MNQQHSVLHDWMRGHVMPLTQLAALGTFFASLDASALRTLEGRVRQLRVRKGQIVIDHGAEGHDVFWVVEGTFDVQIYSPQGREIYIRRISSGILFGEYAALDGGPRSATVVAASDALLAVVTQKDFLEALSVSPKAAMWLARELAIQNRDLTERIFEFSALNVRSRLHCELMRLCMLSGVTGNAATINPAPTHADLANRIGTHREAVTRELNDLAHRNILVQKQRHLEILDVARLSEMVRTMGGDLAATRLREPGEAKG